MPQVDLKEIAQLTAQLKAYQDQLAVTTDPTIRGFLQMQISTTTAQLQGAAQHAQSQIDSTNNILDSLGLVSTLQNALGGVAQNLPSLLSLFKR